MATGAAGITAGHAVRIVLGVALASGGIWLLSARSVAVHRWWARRGLAEPVSPAGAPATGFATVTGGADVASNSPTTAPFSGQDAVGYAYRIEQHTDGVGWWTVAEGGTTVPFRVDGPAEHRRVEPRGEPPDVAMATSELGLGDTLPETVRSRLRDSEEFEVEERPEYLMGFFGDSRRYGEGVLRPGAEIYVTGHSSAEERYRRPTVDARSSSPFRIGTDPPAAALEPDRPHPLSLVGLAGLGLAATGAGAYLLARGVPPALDAVSTLV